MLSIKIKFLDDVGGLCDIEFATIKFVSLSFLFCFNNDRDTRWHSRNGDSAGNTTEENSSVFSLI